MAGHTVQREGLVSMFTGVKVGDRVRMVHRRSRSLLEALVVDVSEYGAWVDLAGGITLYDDSNNGWELL